MLVGKSPKERDLKTAKTPVVKIKLPADQTDASGGGDAIATPTPNAVSDPNVSTSPNKGQRAAHHPNHIVDGARSKSTSHLQELYKGSKNLSRLDLTMTTDDVSSVPPALVNQLLAIDPSYTANSTCDRNAAASDGDAMMLPPQLVNEKPKLKHSTSVHGGVTAAKHRATIPNAHASGGSVTAAIDLRTDDSKKSVTSDRPRALSSGDTTTDQRRTLDKKLSDIKAKNAQNAALDLKLKGPGMLVNSADSKIKSNATLSSGADVKAKSSIASSSESNRAKTPTSLAVDSKSRSSSTSSVAGQSDGAKTVGTAAASVDSSSRSKSTSSEKSSLKSSSSAAAAASSGKSQMRQRKGSLEQVVSKLSVRSQKGMDQTLQKIFKAADHKMSTPIGTIGKISKVSSPITSSSPLPLLKTPSTTKASSSLGKQSSPSLTSLNRTASNKGGGGGNKLSHFSIPKNKTADAKASSVNKHDQRKGHNIAANDSRAGAGGGNNVQGLLDNKRAQQNHKLSPGGHNSQSVVAAARQTLADKNNQLSKVEQIKGQIASRHGDAISEKLQRRHFLDAVKGGGGENERSNANMKHKQYAGTNSQVRAKSPHVKSSDKLNATAAGAANDSINKSKSPSHSTKLNSSHHSQQTGNRPKTPMDSRQKSSSAAADSAKNSAAPSDPKHDVTGHKHAVTAGYAAADHNKRVSPLLAANDDAVKSSPVSPPVTSAPAPAAPASPTPTFYNPAAALKKKAPQPPLVDFKPVHKAAAAVDTSVPVVNAIPLDRVTATTAPEEPPHVARKMTATAPVQVIPLEKPVVAAAAAATVQEPLASDTPSSPLRHETPPASPITPQSKSPVTTRAIPLGKENAVVDTAVTDNPQSPDSEPASSVQAPPVKIIPKTNVNAVKRPPPGVVSSPRSDVSSPESGLVIDCPRSPDGAANSEPPPKAIPLERPQLAASVLSPEQETAAAPSNVVGVASDKSADDTPAAPHINDTLSSSGGGDSAAEKSGGKSSPAKIDDGLMDEALSL